MVKSPQGDSGSVPKPVIPGDRVVISGMAGLYPEAHNVKEFQEILYNKVNPVTSENSRWKYDHPEVAQHIGKVPDLEYFDGQFFKVHYRLGNVMDSMSRKTLEQAFQAIYDAGINSDELSGKKIAVYMGSCFSEAEKANFYMLNTKTGFGIMGCSKSMFANRISYWLNAKGPSLSIDQACCSSSVALELAYHSILQGEIDAAIVGGASLCLLPQSSVHLRRVLTLNNDGKTRSFDKNACGCTKSEAVNVLFLQRAKDALRVYAEVVNVKSEFSGLVESADGPMYGYNREPKKLAGFLNKFLEESKINPEDVEYVEAVGCAAPQNDKMELEVINEVFCKNRIKPLPVGSVMSNIGYGEAASGISAITKVLLGYESGLLASNLHCENPRDDVSGLREGKLSIVTDHRPFNRGYVAINGLSVTGVNSQVLLHGRYKPKDINRYKSNIPHLVTISGRQESAVKKILNDLKSRPIDPEELALFHNIHKTKISAHLGRGFTVLDTDKTNKTISLVEQVDYFDDTTPPLWFVYSGMGSQWSGMGTQLMRIPVFAAAIERCHQALQPKGLDIVHIITTPDKKIMDNILNCFVGIAAVQIGLTDVLNEVGIVPDKIIGHSVGELGCAYADGCLTAEEMILSAYSRGLVSIQTPFIRGSMAAVGLGYEQISKLVPPEIEVACHNSSESSTISGPAEIMKQFVESLIARRIFAKEVPCSNIAYHSRYISKAGPGLHQYLNKVIRTPRLRSNRWISTSIPQDKWNEDLAKYSSAEYHTNNLLNPVLFEESSALIPKNAILVEIAPHGLLQAILKRSHQSCTNIALTRRGHDNNVLLVLEAIGKLYMKGFNPKVQELYPKVEFPVSTGTPMLGHQIEWMHSETWNLPIYTSTRKGKAAECKFLISLHDEEHSYLKGHVIKEKNLYPFAAALVCVWDTFAMSRNCQKKNISVYFENVYFINQPILRNREQLRLGVALHRGTGKFEVTNEDMVVVTGYISKWGKNNDNTLFKLEVKNNEAMTLNSDVIYKLLQARDYYYSGDFQNIRAADFSLTEAKIDWKDNWVTFINGLIQLNALKQTRKVCAQPEFVRKLVINVENHRKVLEDIDNGFITADNLEVLDCTRCGGVLIQNLRFGCKNLFNNLSTNKNLKVSLKSSHFVPHFTDISNAKTTLYTYLQIISENINKNEIVAVKIVDAKNSKSNQLSNVNEDIPGVTVKYNEVTENYIMNHGKLVADVVFVNNFLSNQKLCKILYDTLPRDTFIINKEYTNESKTWPSSLYNIMCAHNVDDKVIQLMKRYPTNKSSEMSVISVRSTSDLDHLIKSVDVLPKTKKLIVFTLYPPIDNLEDLVKGWRKAGHDINLLMMNDRDDLEQNVEALPKAEFAIAVLNTGIWGGYYYLPAQRQQQISNDVVLQSGQTGDIDSLRWVELFNDLTSERYISVQYAGINELDVKRASGIISFRSDSTRTYYGMDFSGETENGTRVMGLTSEGSVCSRIKTKPYLLWPVPDHWSLADAATVPLAYCSALYCLAIKSKLVTGMTVLIHGGCGALGQAAISICLANKCEVFTTVSERSKKYFLKKLFPQLKESNIGYSRDLTFGDMVLSSTNGEGCDIIISCVKGELKSVSLKCCAMSGIIIDTGSIQNREKYNYGMYNMTKSRSFSTVDFSSIFNEGNEEDLKQLQLLLSEGIARGYVRPLTRIIYGPDDVSRAFRLVAASRHRGRVLIQMKQNISSVKTRLNFSPDNYHMIISDEDVLVTQFLDRLVENGIRKIQLICPKSSNFLMYHKRSWVQSGAQIELTAQDVWNKSKISEILDDGLKDTIEGIYIINKNKNDSKKVNEFLEILDSNTRNGCNKLRYFAVINEDSEVGKQICVLRSKVHHPTTFIKLPLLKSIDDGLDQCKISIKNAVDAIEEALVSQNAILTTHLSTTNVLLCEDIASFAGIVIPENVDENTTLLDLGMDLAKSQSVQAYLRDHYYISIEEGEIPNLTLRRLREFEEMVSEKEFYDLQGLATFFSYVDHDELLATTEMVFLPTLTNSSAMRHDEFDATQIFLCLIPGVEGHYKRFTNLCERLKLPAMVLQPRLGETKDTIQDVAQKFAKTLLDQTQLRNFYLLGYESGVCIALEMATILENHGLTGVVYCLGGSPKEIKEQFDLQLSQFGDEISLKEAITKHIIKLMLGSQTQFDDEIILKGTSWNEKVDNCVRALMGNIHHSTQYAKDLIYSAYSRLVQIKQYSPKSRKLRSTIVLLRANFSGSDLEEDNFLQDYSLQPVHKYDLEAPLGYATQDLRCAAIINKHLDDNILKDFENQNLCVTYELSVDSCEGSGN